MNILWKKWYIKKADFISQRSKDRSTKVGAVIVDEETKDCISEGYNGFPRGVDDDVEERHERPIKYLFTEHAERNAIYNAASRYLSGKTMITNYGMCMCADCARAVIQCGIKKVIVPNIPFPGRGKEWTLHYKVAAEMFKEAGVELEIIEDVKTLEDIENIK